MLSVIKRRIRTGKTMNFAYAKNRKYKPRELTPDVVTDVRHLLIPLFEAERAWAYAMDLKSSEDVTQRIANHALLAAQTCVENEDIRRIVVRETLEHLCAIKSRISSELSALETRLRHVRLGLAAVRDLQKFVINALLFH